MTRPYTLGLALLVVGLGATAHAAPELDVLASTDLGDDLGGHPFALAVDDGHVVLAVESEGGHTLVRLDDTGTLTARVEHQSATIDAIAVDRGTGSIALVGGAGLTMLGPDLETTWRVTLPAALDDEPARRIDVGELGTIALVAGGELRTFTASGRELARADLGRSVIADLAVVDTADIVVASGWVDIDDCEESLEIATLAAFGRDGVRRWSAYGEVAEGGCDLARTRGVDVARGEDGLVYMLAEVEGKKDIFSHPTNVAFDSTTTRAEQESTMFAYYARFSPAGEHLLGQYFLIPEASSFVQPSAIAADENGTVYLAGAMSHHLEAEDDLGPPEALEAPVGFYQVIAADFRSRQTWRQVELDGKTSELFALALADDRVITLLQTSPVPVHPTDLSPLGFAALTWPIADPPRGGIKRPDRDDVGTFGYESGVSGSDPVCYCDTKRPMVPSALTMVALVSFVLVCRPRPRGRSSC